MGKGRVEPHRARNQVSGHVDIGARGFDPPTPWSRTRCSTRLSHAPTKTAYTQIEGPGFPRGQSTNVTFGGQTRLPRGPALASDQRNERAGAKHLSPEPLLRAGDPDEALVRGVADRHDTASPEPQLLLEKAGDLRRARGHDHPVEGGHFTPSQRAVPDAEHHDRVPHGGLPLP